MTVIFKNLRYKNFLASGNVPIVIPLNVSPTTLILGDNGQGKSTILDAICFALFKKPFRKIVISLLVNSVNKKNCVVEIEFSVGSREYLVRRGIKPNIFEIYENGNLVDQDSKNADYQEYLEKVIGMTYESFKHLVILGNASYVPFMRLSAAARREFIEELLGISVFSEMNVSLKEKVSDHKTRMQQVNNSIQSLQDSIDLIQGFIEQLALAREREEGTVKNDISVLTADISGIEKEIGDLRNQISSVEDQAMTYDELYGKINTYRTQDVQIESKVETLRKNTPSQDCKSCGQRLSEEIRNSLEEERLSALSKYEDGLSRLRSRIASGEEKLAELKPFKELLPELRLSLGEKVSYLRVKKQQLGQLKERSVRPNIDEDDQRRKLEDAQSKLQLLLQQKDELVVEHQYLSAATVLLKDTGIKASIIKKYVPMIVKQTNKYLAQMDFYCSFALNENFEEVFKARHRDEMTYFSFSEGEKKRIDLALLFTFRDVARAKNSCSTNILMLDEVLDSSLDEVGMDNFLKMIDNGTSSTNVFVISHRGHSLSDKFQDVLRFVKKGQFSSMLKAV